MANWLDYETPPEPPKGTPQPMGRLKWAAAVSGVEQLYLLAHYSGRFDGGVYANMGLVVSLAFWAIVGLIASPLHQRLTSGNLVFVVVGYPLILFPTLLLAFGKLGW